MPHTTVLVPSLLFFQIFSSLPNTEVAFPTLVIISFSFPPVSCQLQHFPSIRKFFYLSIVFPPIDISSLGWHFPMVIIFVFFLHWLSVQRCLLSSLPELWGFVRLTHPTWMNEQTFQIILSQFYMIWLALTNFITCSVPVFSDHTVSINLHVMVLPQIIIYTHNNKKALKSKDVSYVQLSTV